MEQQNQQRKQFQTINADDEFSDEVNICEWSKKDKSLQHFHISGRYQHNARAEHQQPTLTATTVKLRLQFHSQSTIIHSPVVLQLHTE